jgi:uncharacterized membrane protein YcaP (DUF421 family)
LFLKIKIVLKKEDIHIEDIKRILLGETSTVFLLEVFIRTLVVYLGLLFALKLLGKRMTRQLTITEMAVMITLGAIVAVPMQAPDRGIIQGLLILSLAVLFLRGLNFLSFKNKQAEVVIQGKIYTLITDGVLELDILRQLNISRQQVFAILRNRQIYQLGKVYRLYLEACGLFNIYTNDKKDVPGLAIYPLEDKELLEQAERVPGLFACRSCGKLSKVADNCKKCGSAEFIEAIK